MNPPTPQLQFENLAVIFHPTETLPLQSNSRLHLQLFFASLPVKYQTFINSSDTTTKTNLVGGGGATFEGCLSSVSGTIRVNAVLETSSSTRGFPISLDGLVTIKIKNKELVLEGKAWTEIGNGNSNLKLSALLKGKGIIQPICNGQVFIFKQTQALDLSIGQEVV